MRFRFFRPLALMIIICSGLLGLTHTAVAATTLEVTSKDPTTPSVGNVIFAVIGLIVGSIVVVSMSYKRGA